MAECPRSVSAGRNVHSASSYAAAVFSMSILRCGQNANKRRHEPRLYTSVGKQHAGKSSLLGIGEIAKIALRTGSV
eukprot:scaffold229067_cov33-Tisochrysis_lutea.AAC.3